jgi:eukaryotic-like serine/threonine-protein kinase
MLEPSSPSVPTMVGRYVVSTEIASGGMATIHLGRLSGPVGFSRAVAIKRLYPQFAKDPDFVSMFLDEARLAGRIRHPNVVPTLDVVATDAELFIVMEFVLGETLSRLMRKAKLRGEPVPVRIAASIMSGVLQGLHAAHEVKDDRGDSLDIVHRDVSPQNVLVGADGIARVLDFGVAKAGNRLQSTRDGQLKGKINYMAPEQLRGSPVTRQSDVYAAAVVLWELVAGQRLFDGDHDAVVLTRVLAGAPDAPSRHNREVSLGVDAVVMKGLSVDPAQRYATARDMALALERCVRLASPAEVGAWVESLAADDLAKRAAQVAAAEHAPAESAQALAAEMRASPAPPAVPVHEQASQSSISIVRPSSVTVAERGKRRGRGAFVTLLGLAALAAAVAGGFVVRGRYLAGHASSPTSTAPPVSLAAPAVPSSVVVPATVPPIAPTASASVATRAPIPPASASAGRAVTPRPTSRPVTPKPPSRDCDPPYTWDKDGHKIYKLNCL